MPEGSWKCEKCNNINYPFRTKCNRPNCGAEKPSESIESPSQPTDENDQVCCVIHLFHTTISLALSGSLSAICVPLIQLNIRIEILFFIYSFMGTTHFQLFTLMPPFLSSFILFSKFPSTFVSVLFSFVCMFAFINSHLSTVPVSTRACFNGWEGPELSSSIAQCVSQSVMSSSCCSSY